MNTIHTQAFLPVLKINQKTHKSICPNEVIMLRGEVNYTIFCMRNGKRIMVAHTLKYFEELLNKYGFLRVHRAFLVNPKYILNYDEVGHKIEMGSNLFAQVSRRRAKDLNMKSINNFILLNKFQDT
jgi:DNA-binding LytR/AlgR family response regulator